MTENQESGDEKMNSALNALKDFGVSNELSEVINRTSEQQQENTATEGTSTAPEGTQENTEQNNALSNTETQTQGTEAEPATGEKQPGGNEIAIEHEVFGGKKVVVKKDEAEPVTPPAETIDQLNTQIKEKFGFESIDDLTGKVRAWQDQEKVFEETTERLSNVERLFGMMPPELYQAVTAVANGQDWKKVLSESPSVDFRKDVDEYKPKDLVEAYFPGHFSAEDWDEYNEEDGDPKIKKTIDILVDQSKQKFAQTKESIANKATMTVQEAQKQQQMFEQSVQSTVSKLPTQMEGISETYVKKIEKELKSPGSIAKLFYNEDGTLTESGALAYVMAKDGNAILKQYEEAIKKKTETEVNQDLLLRGQRTPEGSRGTQSDPEQIRPEVQKQIDEIRSLAG